jgi:hypothetical protein
LGILPDLDQEKLVMRPSRGERGGGKANFLGWHADLLPAQQIAVEATRAVEVADVKDQVSELFDLHPLRIVAPVATGKLRK